MNSLLQDVKELESKLPNVVYDYLLEDDEFANQDFLIAIDLKTLLYKYVLQVMGDY